MTIHSDQEFTYLWITQNQTKLVIWIFLDVSHTLKMAIVGETTISKVQKAVIFLFIQIATCYYAVI